MKPFGFLWREFFFIILFPVILYLPIIFNPLSDFSRRLLVFYSLLGVFFTSIFILLMYKARKRRKEHGSK